MRLHNLAGRCREGYTTFGSVWNKGEAVGNAFLLTNAEGKQLPVQTRITAYWPDGSVKWAAHTAKSNDLGEEADIEIAEIAMEEQTEKNIVKEAGNGYKVDNGNLSFYVPKAKGEPSNLLFTDVIGNQSIPIIQAYPVLVLENRTEGHIERHSLNAKINMVDLEENGPLQSVLCYQGAFYKKDEELMPFEIRMYVNYKSMEMRFVHTFFYKGNEKKDFLGGMGICFETALTGRSYHRHIKYTTEQRCFHEAATLLNCCYPRLPQNVLQQQMDGEIITYPKESDEEKASEILPIWDRYVLCQDSPSHYAIKKQISPACCSLVCQHGYRTDGVMAVTGADGGIMLAVKEFWKKYPAGMEVKNLGQEKTECIVWFYSPEAESYDFRHYAERSYDMSSYEGFPELGADPNGIGVTSECVLKLTTHVPADKEMEDFGKRVNKPPMYVGTPEYYHEKKAFGNWGLVKTDTEVERWLEEELEKIINFYIEEIDNRNWYGLFDYGDFMHTYDNVRHCWRYDMGGFAWQNTELIPTYWLWTYFLRTGREDVFAVAEAMSRHCSEVDIYHFGEKKGIGSRHNVRHWGCSCKEPRISMAGHHRFYYYLTGDNRIGKVMTEVKDADQSMKNIKYFRNEEKGDEVRVVIRSGPDWSSLVSNWMTEYERTLDVKYRNKIETGYRDIKETPLGLASGPAFVFESESGKLVYQGEDDRAGNMHLQVCMGGPQIWTETAEMLEDEEFKKMIANHGILYYMSQEEKYKETRGLIKHRAFPFPYFAAGIAAYGAWKNKNATVALDVWKELICALVTVDDMSGFSVTGYDKRTDGKELVEIPWMKTNFAAQWCFNTIVALDFIREKLPESLNDMREMLCEGVLENNYHKS